MRRVADQEPALPQRLHHEGKVALLQIAHPAVDQFGAPAGSPLGKVALLQEQGPVAAAGRLHRRTQTGSAAADHDHVPERLSFQPLQQFRTHHGCSQPLVRSRALLQRLRSSAALPRSMSGVNVRSACQMRPISPRSRQYPTASPAR